jgi:hypothetical protein
MKKFKIGDKVIVVDYDCPDTQKEAECNPKLCYNIGQSFTITEIAVWGVVWGSKQKGVYFACLELKAIYDSPLYKALLEGKE